MLCAKRMLTAKAVALLWLPAAAAAQEAPPVTLPTVAVVAPSPLPGLGIDRDKVRSNAQSLQAPQITTQGPTSSPRRCALSAIQKLKAAASIA
jgi:hypothetical protein